MSRKGADPIYLGLILFLFGYVFFADFLISVFGLTFIKGLCAIGTLLFGGAYCVVNFSRLRLNQYLFIPIIVLFVYVFVFHSTHALSYFYTAILAFLLIQNQKKALTFFDFVFIIQFVLVLYEVLTQSLIYTEVTTGLFNARELEQKVELFDESGFRAKGLFTGCLEATSFAINYCFINRNNYKKVIFAFIMALLLNGRMAMVMTAFIFFYNGVIYARQHHISRGTIITLSVIAVVSVGAILVTLAANSLRVYHLLSMFSSDSSSFVARTLSYEMAANEYFNNYGIFQKLVGGEYELFRDYDNVELAAESDVLGMLLEIGLIGFLFILFNMIKAYRASKEKLFESSHISIKMVIVLLFICMIEYRHGAGNIRGVTLWFILFSSYLQNINVPALRRQKKYKYENIVSC